MRIAAFHVTLRSGFERPQTPAKKHNMQNIILRKLTY